MTRLTDSQVSLLCSKTSTLRQHYLQVQAARIEGPAKQAVGPSHFLGLPLEIRRQIYEATLKLTPQEQLSLLSTNQQICDEGRDFVFRRPLVCSSRLRLQAFVNSHPHDVLRQVRSLKLALEELSPAAMQSYLRNAVMGIPMQPSEHPYLLEGELILSCLRLMPNIKHLSLHPPRQRNRSLAPRDLVQYLLTQIPRVVKQLKSLSVSTDITSLDFLLDMPQLQSLRFSGCSETESQSASLVMKQMLCLQELVIVGPSTAFLRRQKCGLQKGPIAAITPDVICNVQGLKRLTIRDMTPAGSSVFLTREMLMAIFDVHRYTLQTLCISSLSQPSTTVLNLLKAVVISLPALQDLQLEWPNITSDFLSDCLPSSIQDLAVTVRCGTHAQDLVDELNSSLHRLPHLRTLHLNLISPANQAGLPLEKQASSFVLPIQAGRRYVMICTLSFVTADKHIDRLESRWRTTWGVWEPAGCDEA